MKIINLGCGNESYGDVRVDFVKTSTTTHICDLNKPLPFKDNSFDKVYCKSILEHVGNVKQFIDECMRILKVGGTFYFRTDNSTYLGHVFKSHQSYLQFEDWSKEDKHYYLFKKEHLINFFGDKVDLQYACQNKKVFFLPKKYKCFHIDINGVKEK